MTITNISSDKTQVLGYRHYNSGNFSQLGLTTLKVVSNILTMDLAAVPPPGYTSPQYVVSWLSYISVGGVIAQVSQYKSALNKYNLGIVDTTFQGFCVDSHFLNYEAQVLPVYTSFSKLSNITYPSSFTIPATTANNQVESLQSADYVDLIRGDSLYIRLDGADATKTEVYVAYSASAILDGNTAIYSYI
jgi:hypothetical protein